MGSSLKFKLLGSNLFLTFITIIIGVLGSYIFTALSKNFNSVVNEQLPITKDLGLIDMAHDGLKGVAIQAYFGYSTANSNMISSASEDFTDYKDNITKYFDDIQNKESNNSIKQKVTSIKKDFFEYLNSVQLVIQLAKSNRSEIKDKFESALAHFEKLEKELSDMQSLILKNNEGFYTKSYKQMSLLNMLLWIILSASVLFSLIISVTISNTTIKKLDSIAESVSDTTTAIGFSISQLLSSSEELSSAVAEEASAIQETASSVEEISSMVEKTAKNAEESNKVSQGSKEKAEKGQIIMNELSSAIQKISSNNEAIATEVSASNERINEIIAVIEEIGVKTKVINDIVFQTKLLSFNASVEAARAGDNGKGFAVVAEEVGNLAEMSGNAAKEITTMLDSSMDKVEAIADESKRKIQTLVDQAVDTVQKGSRIANNFTEILSDVVRDSQLASSLSQDINNANKEQAYGVREVSKAINLLNESTQTNASVAQTNESATESLKSLSNDLREASSGLKSFILGKISVPRFIWKDEYALNVSQMDAEHKVLIQKINNLAAVIEANSGKNNSKVLNAFDELATYTVKHFSDEEVFQASINYPHLEAHKEIHRRLLNSVKKYRTDLETGDYNLSELMRFLNDWLVSHILNVDMKYSKFFQQQNKVG